MQPTPAQPRRTVVTGSAGFIGSHLCRVLLDQGETVIGVDRRDPDTDPAAAAALAPLIGHPRFVPVTADLSTCPLDALLLDTDTVFHLAAIPGVRPSWGPRFPQYVDANLHVPQRLMDTAIRLQVPNVVVASSSSVYGRTNGAPSNETDSPRPASPYAVTKLATEQLCLAHAAREDSRTRVTALRYFTVYGPGQRPDMFIHRVLRAALQGQPVQIYGDGRQRRDFTHVDDAVRATIAAARVDHGQPVFNVGGGSSADLAAVLDHVERLTGAPVPVTRSKSRAGDVPATLADPTRIRSCLGWNPEHTLESGITSQWREQRAAYESPLAV
ncbi:NAD-dependent epimerase/dehydratase family protein [Streptomyces sp. NPDC088785]|uniref:NAD-dependent epimerase/dehydratase family protein n=1 Tax=Streptomyces sp. NPDC088785 TaxID=3365897 RepID=UPI0038075FD8